MIDTLTTLLGPTHVLTGSDATPYALDWAGQDQGTPLAVLRPGSAGEVSAILKIANQTRTPVVPVSGRTGLTGGTAAPGALLVSLERMNTIREIRPAARVTSVEAGAVLGNGKEVEENG